MGTWGFGILDSDTALDVYGAYMDLYNVDTPTDEIRPQIEQQFPWALGALDECSDFWLALAQAQWECKALDDDVAATVAAIVERNLEEDIWGRDYPKRRAVLKRFLGKISRPKARPKKRTPPKFFDAPFKKGDCLAFQHRSGFYGGAICLEAMPRPQRIATNVIALLRLRQDSKPVVADFLRSHVLVKSWGEADGKKASWARSPVPALWAIGVGRVKELREARSNEVVGSVEVGRAFGDAVYGFTLNWRFDDQLDYQFCWEEKHPELKIDLSFPVAKLIEPAAGDHGALGEAFARSQQRDDNPDYAEYHERCRAFETKMKELRLSPDSELYRFLASYAGTTPKRARNRVADILRNAR